MQTYVQALCSLSVSIPCLFFRQIMEVGRCHCQAEWEIWDSAFGQFFCRHGWQGLHFIHHSCRCATVAGKPSSVSLVDTHTSHLSSLRSNHPSMFLNLISSVWSADKSRPLVQGLLRLHWTLHRGRLMVHMRTYRCIRTCNIIKPFKHMHNGNNSMCSFGTAPLSLGLMSLGSLFQETGKRRGHHLKN